MSQNSILYLVPDLLGSPGGIARYCQMVCRALQNAQFPLQVVALEDKLEAMPEVKKTFSSMCYKPCGGSRATFLYQALITTLRVRPSIILIGHPHFATVGWLLAKLVGARLVTFIYGIDVWHTLPQLRRYGLCQSDKIISISQFTARQAIQANRIESSKIRILYNCVDPRFANDAEPVSTRNQLSMLTVGRISSIEFYKGHNYVIKSMPALLNQFPNLVYNIVGDGDGRHALEKLASEVGVIHAVHFHGVISDKELQAQYTNASLFVMPSRNEGFGFVFAEAMVQGVPAIGGNVDATPEVIVDGETGFLVNPTSVEEIVSAVAKLLSNNELRNCMGQAARAHVQKNFSFAKFQEMLCDYLAELDITSSR